MEQRLNFFQAGPDAFKALGPIAGYLSKSTLDTNLLHLVYFRVSQINGCAYCLDMHSKDLRAAGETEQRLYMVSAWHETTLFTEKEEAALALAEAVTNIQDGVSDAVYDKAKEVFSDAELVALTLAIGTINIYNRFNVTFRSEAGSYKVGQFSA